jgi:hypothetical protein
MIAATHQRDGRPEGAHARQVDLPVMHLSLEDRADQRVKTGTAVEGACEPLDHRFVDPGPRNNISDD